MLQGLNWQQNSQLRFLIRRTSLRKYTVHSNLDIVRASPARSQVGLWKIIRASHANYDNLRDRLCALQNTLRRNEADLAHRRCGLNDAVRFMRWIIFFTCFDLQSFRRYTRVLNVEIFRDTTRVCGLRSIGVGIPLTVLLSCIIKFRSK